MFYWDTKDHKDILSFLLCNYSRNTLITTIQIRVYNFIFKMDRNSMTKITPANCRDGPRTQRSYTNCFCCIVYLLYCAAIIILGILFSHQSVYGFQRPFDYDHNVCIKNYSILYLPTQDMTNTVCINACPINKIQFAIKCQINTRYPVCPTALGNLKLDNQYKICHDQKTKLDDVIQYNFVRQALNSIFNSKYQILAAAAACLIISFLMLLLTFILPSIMTYLYFILFGLLLLIMGAGFIYRYIMGKLPFIDQNSEINYKNSVITLILGILFGLAFIITFIVLIVKRIKFKYVTYILKIAKKCFWDNCYIVFISILLSLLSIAALIVNMVLLYISTSMGTIRSDKHQPFTQFQHNHFAIWYSVLILIQFIWTHGIIIALSEFTFQSIAIHWYFNQRKLGPNYSRCQNFAQTVRLTGKHIGTICTGWILSWIPQTIISEINKLQTSLPNCYRFCCCIHNCSCKYFSIYGYSQTILQSLPFLDACEQMFYLRKRTKNAIPNLYMMGNFFLTSSKLFIELLTMLLLYIICAFSQPDTYDDVINLIVPLLLIWIIAAEISTHFMSITGIMADTLVLMYSADIEMQKYGYGSVEAYSCPKQIRPLIRQAKAL